MAFEVSVKTEEEVNVKVLVCDHFQDEALGKKFASAPRTNEICERGAHKFWINVTRGFFPGIECLIVYLGPRVEVTLDRVADRGRRGPNFRTLILVFLWTPGPGQGGEGLRLAVGRDVMQNEAMCVLCVFGREECVGASGHVLASFRCNWFMLGHPARLGVGVLS